MKNILIIGGAGYIGTRLSNHLSKKNKIHVIDNFWFGDHLNDNIIKTKKNLWNLSKEDFLDFDCVLFLAGLANDPMACFRPDLSFIENGAAPAYSAFLAKEAGIKRFIYASSCSVYGYTNNEILNENSLIKPHYPYGISKLQSEYGIMVLEDENFKPIIFRKGTVGGWSEKMRYDLVVNTMIKNGLSEKIITVNNPNLWRPLVDIRDIISGYELAIESNLKISGIFNISGINLTIGELGKIIYNKFNSLNIPVELKMNNIEDVRNYKVDTQKIKNILNFSPKYKPEDTIDEILNNINEKTDFKNDIFYNINTFKNILKDQKND